MGIMTNGVNKGRNVVVMTGSNDEPAVRRANNDDREHLWYLNATDSAAKRKIVAIKLMMNDPTESVHIQNLLDNPEKISAFVKKVVQFRFEIGTGKHEGRYFIQPMLTLKNGDTIDTRKSFELTGDINRDLVEELVRIYGKGTKASIAKANKYLTDKAHNDAEYSLHSAIPVFREVADY